MFDRLRFTLSDSRHHSRSFNVAFAGLFILFAGYISAAGQNPGDIVPHSTPTEVAEAGELNKGAEAFRGARFDEAIAHFQKASELVPDEPIAKLYLGTALSQKLVPRLETPENLNTAQKAINNFQQFLEKRPPDLPAMQMVAAIEFTIKRLDDAKAWQKKVLVEDPKDPDAAYTIGLIDWTQAQENAVKALESAGIHDDGEGNAKAPVKLIETIKAQNGPLVEGALKYLGQAIENRPNYDAPMTYMSLAYRRMADLDWGDEAARKDDIAKANEWIARAMNMRRENEERNQPAPNPGLP